MKLIQKYKKPLAILLKLLIFCLATGYIYSELDREDSLQSWNTVKERVIAEGFNWQLVSVLILLPVNFFFEVFKWQLILRKVEKISLKRAAASVFSGLGLGIFTPNHIGEYGGRILYLKEENRVKGLLVNFMSSFSQMMITILFGSIAYLVYAAHYMKENELLNTLLLYLAIVANLLLLYFFFNLSRFSSYLSGFKLFSRFSKYTSVFASYHWPDLLPVYLLAMLRYFIFSLQYLLLLNYFVPDLPAVLSAMMISLVFFVQSVLPGFTFTEPGVRGAVASYFLGQLSANTIGIIASAFSIWLINIILPSLIGVLFVIKANFFGHRR